MAENQHSSIPTESARLVKALLDRHRDTVSKEDNPLDSGLRNINWVACKDFTVGVGLDQIREYIQTWGVRPCWLYSLDFLDSSEWEYHTFHHYRARFSTPTPQRPVQGTASVYFVVDVSKVKPSSVPVEVRFIVESNRLVHAPGRSRFREKWLEDVVESKTLLRQAVRL